MINLSDDVRRLLKDGRGEYCASEEICFRLMPPAGGRVTLMLDVPEDDDVVVEDGGVILLLVGRGVASTLEGTTLGIEETEAGPRLVINQPSAVLV
jgi:Fe-S cluster assembly iron-binding protein IscA